MSNVVYWEDSDDLTYNQPNSVKWPDPNANTIITKKKPSYNYALFVSLFFIQFFSFLIDLFVIRILWICIYNFLFMNTYVIFVK
jgi:hypothetical protein